MGSEIFQQVLNWLTAGAIYTLIAVGFSLLFGVLKVIHFSHGDVAMVAPFIALAVLQWVIGTTAASVGDLLLGCIVAVAVVGVLGVVLDKLVIQRFRNSPEMMALVATVAIGIVIRESVRHFFPNGANPHPFPRLVDWHLDLPGGLQIPGFSLFTIVTSVVTVGLLFLLLHRTPLGARIRAVSQDHEAARLMAIDPRQIFFAAFFIASAVGAIGGLFIASYTGVVRYDFSLQVGLIGFSAAVIGGLGSMTGAILGSLLICGVDTLVQSLVPNGAAYRLVFAFAIVIAVLIFRPAGLFGRVVVEKV
jgi:branched-chain amino acid transport system permease protein